MLEDVQIGKIYTHVKTGKQYHVLRIAYDTENHQTKLVIYQSELAHRSSDSASLTVWARPFKLFCEKFEEPPPEVKIPWAELGDLTVAVLSLALETAVGELREDLNEYTGGEFEPDPAYANTLIQLEKEADAEFHRRGIQGTIFLVKK